MKLVPARCTQCGHVLKVNPQEIYADCDNCDAQILVEKAIAKYDIDSQIALKHEGEITQDEMLDLAYKHFEIRDDEKGINYVLLAQQQGAVSAVFLQAAAMFKYFAEGKNLLSKGVEILNEYGNSAASDLKEAPSGSVKIEMSCLTFLRFREYILGLEERVKNSIGVSEKNYAKAINAALVRSDEVLLILPDLIKEKRSIFGEDFSPEECAQQLLQHALNLLETISLCYAISGYDRCLSAPGAQHLYDNSQRLWRLAELNNWEIKRCQRLLPPIAGGEGIHVHCNGAGESIPEYVYYANRVLSKKY